jgi:dUTP pyrophosphatase
MGIDNIKNINENQQNAIDTFAQILALPDEEFKTFSQLFLDTLEKELTDPKNISTIQIIFKNSGIDVENFVDSADDLCESLKEKYGKDLGEDRIDFLVKMVILFKNAVRANGNLGKKIVTIQVEKCSEDTKIPTYARVGDAGMDIYSTEEVTLAPGEKKLIGTGIKVAIPEGYEIEVVPKSGIALKTGLKVSNSPGTIDSGYRDEIKVIIENSEPSIKDIEYTFDNNGNPVIKSILHGKSYTIEKGQKIAQIILKEVPMINFQEVKNISEISGDRGGGFGSTGLK